MPFSGSVRLGNRNVRTDGGDPSRDTRRIYLADLGVIARLDEKAALGRRRITNMCKDQQQTSDESTRNQNRFNTPASGL